MRKSIVTFAGLVLVGGALAACSSSNSGGALPDTDSTPNCSDVWVAGQTLPVDYAGCMDGDRLQVSGSFNCADGTDLHQFQDDFWAFGGQEVHEEPGGVASAKAYGEAYRACQG